jgi:hypothetical protein
MRVADSGPVCCANLKVISDTTGFTNSQYTLIAHIRGILETEFGKRGVQYELVCGEQPETGIRKNGEFIPLLVELQTLIRERNRDSGVKYRLEDVDRVTFEFFADEEGGKIVMSTWPKYCTTDPPEPISTSSFSAVRTKIEISGVEIRRK